MSEMYPTGPADTPRGLFTPASVIPSFVSLVLLLAAIIPSTGCGVYRNLTTYYNTFYNAQHLFDDAIAEMQKSPQKDRDTNFFARWSVPGPTQGKFDSVIAKCSKVIQFHAESKYIDDALLMIGEAYAYQGDAESALRKFRELIETFPESDLRFQARLWEAKTLYYDKKYDEAVTVAHQAAEEAEKGDQNDVLIEAFMLQAQVAMDKKEFDVAASWYEKAVQPNDADQLRLMASYQMGAAYDSLGKPDKAAKAYKSMREYGPDYATRFKADYCYGRMLEQLGEYKTALKLFDDLKYDVPRPEDKALLDLELAKTYTLMGDTGQAFDFYRYMDTVYRASPAIERSYYERGRLFEVQYNDLKSATSYYKLAQTTNLNTPEGNRARQKYLVFNHYFTVLNNLHVYDSLLHPELYKTAADSADSLNALHSDSLKSVLGDSTTSALSKQPPSDGHQLAPPPAGAEHERPELAANDPHPASKEDDDEDVDRDRVTGRGADLHGAAPKKQPRAMNDDAPRKSKGDRSGKMAGVPDTLDGKPMQGGAKQAPPKPKTAALTPDSVKKLICRARFELAGIYYLELNRPDSAATTYQSILDDTIQTSLHPATVYALSEIRRSSGDSLRADSLDTHIILHDGRTEYAKKVKLRRGLDTADQIDPHWAKYRRAMDSLYSGNYKESMQMLVSLYADSTDSSAVAAKSLYTAGWILENQYANNDSAAALYKWLMHRFPTSEYVSAVQPKVAVKDDPKTLSQFVKVKEITAIARPVKKNAKHPGEAVKQEGDENADEEIDHDEDLIRARGANRDVNDDEPDDTDTSSDDDSDNN